MLSPRQKGTSGEAGAPSDATPTAAATPRGSILGSLSKMLSYDALGTHDDDKLNS